MLSVFIKLRAPVHNYPNSRAVMPDSIPVTVLVLLIIDCGYSKCERQFWRLMLLGGLLLLILVAGRRTFSWVRMAIAEGPHPKWGQKVVPLSH